MRRLSFFALSLILGFSLACGRGADDDEDDDDEEDDESADESDDDEDVDNDEDTPDDPSADDDDGDGLSNTEEAEIGTDPDKADTDRDGVDDGDEVTDGTNPNFEYSVVLAEGDYVVGACPELPASDAGPTDTASFTYQGERYEWDAYREGDTVSNWKGMDAYGQDVSIYNFCGNYVLVSVGAFWCAPCQDLAEDLPDEQAALVADIGNFTFFEMLTQNLRGSTPSEEDLDE